MEVDASVVMMLNRCQNHKNKTTKVKRVDIPRDPRDVIRSMLYVDWKFDKNVNKPLENNKHEFLFRFSRSAEFFYLVQLLVQEDCK